MKKFIKAMAVAVSLVFAFISCDGNGDDGTDPEVSAKTDLELACDALSVTDEIATDSFVLPTVSSQYPSITISWTSSDTELITIDSNGSASVTQKDATLEEQFDVVTLTATLQNEEGEILEKHIDVKVYRNGADFPASKIFEIAESQFLNLVKVPGLAWAEYDFGTKLSIGSKNVTAVVTTDDTNAAKIDGNGKISVYRGLTDREVKFTLNFTIDGSQYTKTYEETLTLPAVTELSMDREYEDSYGNISTHYASSLIFNPKDKTFVYQYDKTEKYLKDVSGHTAGEVKEKSDGAKGTYVLDENGETVRLTFSEIYTDGHGMMKEYQWVTSKKLIGMVSSTYISAFKVMEAYETNPTIETFYAYMSFMNEMQNGNALSEEEFFTLLEMTKADYEAMTEENKQAVIKSGLSNLAEMKARAVSMYGLPEGSDYKDLYAALEVQTAKMIGIDQMFLKDTLFSVDLDYKALDKKDDYASLAWATFTGMYDSSKPWYLNYGEYNNGSRVYKEQIYIRYNLGYICYLTEDYDEGSWNDDYTEYKQDSTVLTVTDNHDGTILLKRNDDDPVTLSFDGEPLK